MPRGGSRKGEHRGSAKRAAKKLDNRRNNQRPTGSRNKHTLEVENEIARIINPISFNDLFPKEQMLLAMRELMNEFAEWKAMEAEERSAVPLDEGNIRRSVYARGKAREALILATDFSYKAAPYLHPRLAAMAIMQNDNENPRNIVQAMLDEIDRRSRDAKMIENRANDDVLGEILDNDEDVA